MDENGENYNSTMSITGPYGLTNTFTGPKVTICLCSHFVIYYINTLTYRLLCTILLSLQYSSEEYLNIDYIMFLSDC